MNFKDYIILNPQRSFTTREEILNIFYDDFIKPIAKIIKLPIEDRPMMSFGIPTKRKAIGQCFTSKPEPEITKHHIFISPTLTDPMQIFETLIHEAIHTVYMNHGKKFGIACDYFNLEGKRTATYAGPQLAETIQEFCTFHKITKISFFLNPFQTKKKQTTRMIKLTCPECEYIIRTSLTNIIEKGLPLCPCGGIFNNPDLELPNPLPEEEPDSDDDE